MLKKIILPISMLVLFNACKTVDQNVQQLVHTRQVSEVTTTNPYKQKYIANAQGKYELLNKTPLTLDANGSFRIGDVEYFIQQVLNEHQAIYVAVTPDPNSSKKIYTYHGIIATGTSLLSAPYTAPTFENKKALTEKDTPLAWQVNTFQPENINWESGFSTQFAEKVSR